MKKGTKEITFFNSRLMIDFDSSTPNAFDCLNLIDIGPVNVTSTFLLKRQLDESLRELCNQKILKKSKPYNHRIEPFIIYAFLLQKYAEKLKWDIDFWMTSASFDPRDLNRDWHISIAAEIFRRIDDYFTDHPEIL